MLEQGYFITAELRVKNPENVEHTKSQLTLLCQKTIEEPGCTLFSLHQCKSEPTRLLLWERFNSEEDYKIHFQQPHTLQYLAQDLTEIEQFFASLIVT